MLHGQVSSINFSVLGTSYASGEYTLAAANSSSTVVVLSREGSFQDGVLKFIDC
jgi:hypothetical protein